MKNTHHKLVREIMGKNFFNVEEAIQHYRVQPTRAQLSNLFEIPFTETELREGKDTHVLVAVFPLSILKIRDKVEHELFYGHEDTWYNKQVFAKDYGKTYWQFVRKTPVENSMSETWQKQQELLAKNEETPTAQVMVYIIIGYFLATGERLLEKIYVRCSNIGLGGNRVGVGYFDSRGLDIAYPWDSLCSDDIGVASARKFD